MDEAAVGILVLLDGRKNHRARCGLGRGIARHQLLLASPASTGSVMPVM